MKVLVKNLGGRPLKLELDISPQDTVASLKAQVEAADGVLHYQQKLCWGGKQLQDLGAKLESYGMRDAGDGKVHKIGLLRTYPPPDWIPFQLEVRTRPAYFMIEVKPRDTMEAVKETIQRAKGWKASELLLLFDDATTVKGNHFDESSSLMLYAKPGSQCYGELGGAVGAVGSDGDDDEDEDEDENEGSSGGSDGGVGVGGDGGEESDVSDEDETAEEAAERERRRGR